MLFLTTHEHPIIFLPQILRILYPIFMKNFQISNLFRKFSMKFVYFFPQVISSYGRLRWEMNILFSFSITYSFFKALFFHFVLTVAIPYTHSLPPNHNIGDISYPSGIELESTLIPISSKERAWSYYLGDGKTMNLPHSSLYSIYQKVDQTYLFILKLLFPRIWI